MDFRRADPTYVNWVPKTCMDAIDLFNRHRDLGLTADLYPECFVHCARALPPAELDMFHRFIVTPSGDISSGGETPTLVDHQLEKERQVLLKEAEIRDSLAHLTIDEEDHFSEAFVESSTEPMSCDDEKWCGPEEKSAEYIKISSAQ